MEIFKKNFKIKASSVILILLFIGTVILLAFYFKCDGSMDAILASLVAGFAVASIQFSISFQDYRATEKLKQLELVKILYSRSDRSYYAGLIKNAKTEIVVMGVTAQRMLNDFADMDNNASEDRRVLLSALENNVRVRILLPNKQYLPEGKESYYEEVRTNVSKINEQNSSNKIEIRYFNHIAAHSIFKVDDECIVGPVLPSVESRNTPSLHLRNKSPFADKYLKYFEQEWNDAKNE